MQRRQRRREGTTLIELMVVLVIMAMMAAAVGIPVINSWNTAKKHDTATRARTLQSAATQYLFENNGSDCPTVEDLDRSNILDKTTEHTDGWGNPFKIECEETTVHVHSPGPDQALGTADDIGF